ncbi:hypothetical protein HLB23_14060 [Nocardia uniformis]|uniref:Mce-associated membrane protein n=1 Tax=Nocardia uniformis TaxID=53432 RepID=A0A849BWJ7_9NOCA|nr:hypothetical protein [Nocardia uniformis]NNH70973.1 hypothetical protein [Nocardia uniformis]
MQVLEKESVSASEDVAQTSAKPVARRRPRLLVLGKRQALAVALALVLCLAGTGSACAYFAITKHSAAAAADSERAAQADREAATKAGSDFLTTMFTVDKGSLDRWDAMVVGATTDAMHPQLVQWRGVLEKLVGANVEMSSKVTSIGVRQQTGPAVTLIAVIESTGRTDPDAQPGTSSSAALIELRQIDGRWKVQSYGPAGAPSH